MTNASKLSDFLVANGVELPEEPVYDLDFLRHALGCLEVSYRTAVYNGDSQKALEIKDVGQLLYQDIDTLDKQRKRDNRKNRLNTIQFIGGLIAYLAVGVGIHAWGALSSASWIESNPRSFYEVSTYYWQHLGVAFFVLLLGFGIYEYTDKELSKL